MVRNIKGKNITQLKWSIKIELLSFESEIFLWFLHFELSWHSYEIKAVVKTLKNKTILINVLFGLKQKLKIFFHQFKIIVTKTSTKNRTFLVLYLNIFLFLFWLLLCFIFCLYSFPWIAQNGPLLMFICVVGLSLIF